MPEILLLAGGATVAAEPGDSVLSAMLRAREKIHPLCKRNGICGACRVLVDDAFFHRLNPPSASEIRMLKFLRSREANQEEVNHRLACQIILDESLTGLRFRPDPVIPRPPNKEIKP
jgi:ferredoxin